MQTKQIVYIYSNQLGKTSIQLIKDPFSGRLLPIITVFVGILYTLIHAVQSSEKNKAWVTLNPLDFGSSRKKAYATGFRAPTDDSKNNNHLTIK